LSRIFVVISVAQTTKGHYQRIFDLPLLREVYHADNALYRMKSKDTADLPTPSCRGVKHSALPKGCSVARGSTCLTKWIVRYKQQSPARTGCSPSLKFPWVVMRSASWKHPRDSQFQERRFRSRLRKLTKIAKPRSLRKTALPRRPAWMDFPGVEFGSLLFVSSDWRGWASFCGQSTGNDGRKSIAGKWLDDP